MTRPVDRVGPLSSVDRRKVERRDGQRRAPGASLLSATSTSAPDMDDVGPDKRPQAPAPPPTAGGVDAAAAFAAQQMGQSGQKRGLRGGPPVLDAARSAYLGAEYSGSNERRPQPGRLDDTEA